MVHKLEIKGNKGVLTVEFDVNNTGELSSSGKTYILDSSRGFVWDGDIGISYNIVKRRRK